MAIAAVLDDRDRVLMLWRYRFVPDRWGWELPGGMMPMIGMVDSPHEVYVGRGASHVGDPTDVEESGRVDWISLTDVPALLGRGELAGSGTLIALLHVLALGAPSVG